MKKNEKTQSESDNMGESQNKENLINPKDIYESLWKCRDFELSHLWQRSVFLTAFLVMCFTGYGAILLKVCGGIDDAAKGTPDIGFFILNVAGIFVIMVGFIMSLLWVMMGKGSKAWYEMYESAICNIERDEKYAEKIVANDMDEDRVMHGSLPILKVKTGIFNTNAGKYSVSKINIAIGHVSMIIWAVLFLVHSLLCVCSDNFMSTILAYPFVIAGIFVAGCILGCIALVVWISKQCKSTSIEIEQP